MTFQGLRGCGEKVVILDLDGRGEDPANEASAMEVQKTNNNSSSWKGGLGLATSVAQANGAKSTNSVDTYI